MDRLKLSKLLAMTTSPHDGEALNAMRMANAMVKEAKLTWDEVLAQPHQVNISIGRTSPFHDITPKPAPQADGAWTAPHLSDKIVIGTMFRTVYAGRTAGNEDFWKWVDDVYHQFTEHGSLTSGQYEALRRSYRRAVKTRRA